MHIVRVGLLALFIAGLAGTVVRAQVASPQAAAPAQSPAQDTAAAQAGGTAPAGQTAPVKIVGKVVEVKPAQAGNSATLVLDVAGKLVQVPVPGDATDLANIAAGMFVAVKGTPDGAVRVEVQKDPDGPELKGVLAAVNVGPDGGAVTLRVGNQDITLSAADLGLAPEVLAKFQAGDRIKIKVTDKGAIQIELVGQAGKAEVTVYGGEVKTEFKQGGDAQEVGEANQQDEDENNEERNNKDDQDKNHKDDKEEQGQQDDHGSGAQRAAHGNEDQGEDD